MYRKKGMERIQGLSVCLSDVCLMSDGLFILSDGNFFFVNLPDTHPLFVN